jgi:hypothetical protein
MGFEHFKLFNVYFSYAFGFDCENRLIKNNKKRRKGTIIVPFLSSYYPME